MERKHVILSLLAAFALAGCTNEDASLSGKDSNNTISDGTPRYITVSINSTDGALQGKSTVASNAKMQGTRANNFQTGSNAENTVTNVRFYFFNEDGSTARVKGSGNNAVNYLDWTPTTAEGGTIYTGDVNVEKTLLAHLVINTSEGDRLPSKMLAVLNDDFTQSKYDGNKSLTQLREITDDYKNLADNGKFIMANSVYSNASKERISTTTITSDNMKGSEADANNNPVQMYVERNVAKVTVMDGDNASKEDNGNYSLKDANGNALKITIINKDGTTEEKALFFKLTGWNLTATTNNIYLNKHIDPQWSFTNWTNSPSTGITAGRAWNDEANHRSYWAYNVITNNADGSGQVYDKSYNDISIALTNYVYTNENAATTITYGGERDYPTQAVVAGILVDDNGSPVTVGEFTGTYYTEEALKNALYNNLSLYTDEFTDNSNETRKKLSIDNLEFISESVAANKRGEAALNSQMSDARCYVELALNGKYTGNLYLSSGKDATALNATNAEVLNALKSAGQAFLYKNGLTYYWFKVKHLAAGDRGEYGIVRNHMYKCKINSITGLGTPVFDPTETIYPETPIDVDTYISAQINILSWRNVDSDVDLGK